MSRRSPAFRCALLAWGLALAPAVASADGDQARLDYRQKLMKGVGADMGAIGDIMKHDLPFLANVAVHAARLERSAELVPSAFEARVVDGPTDAKPAIWEQPERFREVTEDFRREAAKLAEVAATGDRAAVGAQVKALGKSCGGCHKTFRKPKEESYKRR